LFFFLLLSTSSSLFFISSPFFFSSSNESVRSEREFQRERPRDEIGRVRDETEGGRTGVLTTQGRSDPP